MGLFDTPEPPQIGPPPPPIEPEPNFAALAQQRRRRESQRKGRASFVIEPALNVGGRVPVTERGRSTGISIPRA